MKSALAVSVLWLTALVMVSAADPSFNLSDLAGDERLLFTSTTDQPGWGTYETLFLASLADGDGIETLTHFPERTRYFPNTSELEIQNRFGLYRISIHEGYGIRELEFHPSFCDGADIAKGRILPVASSPDGRWILIQEPDGPVRGRLVLYGAAGGEGILISLNHVLDYQAAPALWSPDSRYMLYARDGRLFYVSARHMEESRLPDESYREFGEGTLSSVQWTSPDTLYYIRGSLVSLVRPSEFFTRSFYSEPLPIGSTAGKLPVEFDPNFDTFWPAPDGSSLIVLKEERNLFRFPLKGDNGEEALSLPFLHLPGESKVLQLWWRSGGDIYILTGGSRRGSTVSRLYHLDSDAGENARFKDKKLPEIRRFVPSPDRSLLAVLENEGVSLRIPDTLEEIRYITHPDPRDLFWIDGSRLLIVGGRRIEIAAVDGVEKVLISLSQVDKAGFDAEETIGSVSGGRHFRLQPDSRLWTAADEGTGRGIRTPRLESPVNRVYLDDNIIMVRTVDGFGNRVLFRAPASDGEFPHASEDEALSTSHDEGVFNHGSRNRRLEVALVFNAVDSDDGLGEVLNILTDYGLRVTFFVGGNFIRRQPEAARLLADSGHEIGSLFYTHMDMTDYRYRIDTEFVVRGMGRNEDEYFRATGEEVSTLWHAPWYVISPPILDATAEMNYLYVGRDVDPLDWVVLDGPAGTRDLYRRSPELVERVLEEKSPGSIIPVRVGKPGNRDDYFFRKLDLLINGLLKEGYEIVTVSELKERLQ